jgi:hypothetical protein
VAAALIQLLLQVLVQQLMMSAFDVNALCYACSTVRATPRPLPATTRASVSVSIIGDLLGRNVYPVNFPSSRFALGCRVGGPQPRHSAV